MIVQLAVGTFLIILTVFIHAAALDIIIRDTRKWHPPLAKKFYRTRKGLKISAVILGVCMANALEILLWALFYLGADALPENTLESALYFSTSSFTTVGFGDLVLDEKWRFLSAIESVNGFILFGWSTAFIFEIISQLYRKEAEALKQI